MGQLGPPLDSPRRRQRTTSFSSRAPPTTRPRSTTTPEPQPTASTTPTPPAHRRRPSALLQPNHANGATGSGPDSGRCLALRSFSGARGRTWLVDRAADRRSAASNRARLSPQLQHPDQGAPTVMATRTHVEIDRARIKELTAREAARLDERTPGSRAFYARAQKSLVGGVASSYQSRDPWPIYLSRGKGAHVWDVDGNELPRLPQRLRLDGAGARP